jgi:phenylalanyl-tRNA synthetase beta chain
MKISYKWLGEWVDLSGFKNPQELADLLTARGLEVESLEAQDRGLEKVVSAQIILKEKHPEADRLSLCKVNVGGGAEYLDIVCGAQNMKVGDVVALARIGANLPNGMKIEKGKIRGAVSMGMLCSEAELGFAKESEGILILPPKTPVGWKLADVLGLDDVILEIKLTANRGDCLSHRGIAREVAAAIGKPLKEPRVPAFQGAGSPIRVELEAGEAAPQFFGAFMTGVKFGPSPAWLKGRLEAIGQRSINNLVDASNFLMFELGFPVHIYDADKLEGGVIRVRRSVKGEKIPLLDGGEIETTGEELVIADGAKPVGLAGVMGGGNSEVSETTKNVFLECAEFDPVLVRRAAFRFGRRSEASLRFEKGIDPRGHRYAISRLIDLVAKLAEGELQGTTCAEHPVRRDHRPGSVLTSASFLNGFLGTEVPVEKMASIFESLDCAVERDSAAKDLSGDGLRITAPSWRLDLNIREDYAEELARTLGYDSIPTTIPALSGAPKSRKSDPKHHRARVLDQMKDVLAGLGLHEGLSYAFQSEQWLSRFGMRSTVRILNPLSEDQGFLVPSLLPGMMKAYLENERHHFGSEPLSVRMFEVRPVFSHAGGVIEARGEAETGVIERYRLSVLLAGPRLEQGLKAERGNVDFFDLKSVFESLFERLRTKGIRSRPADEAFLGSEKNLYHPGQCLQFAAGKDPIGFIGRIHPRLEAELKLSQAVYWGEIDVEPLIGLTPSKEASFKPWAAFPTMERDFALLVQDSVLAENLAQSALKSGKPIAKVVKIFDTYRGTGIPEGMVSIGVRVIFSDESKSLEEKQVEQCSELIVQKWQSEFGAALR